MTTETKTLRLDQIRIDGGTQPRAAINEQVVADYADDYGSGVDLDKLARLGDMLNEVKAGTLSLADAAPRLDAIKRAAPPWGTFAGMLGRAFVALGLAPLLGGGGGPIRCCLSCLVYSSAASSCFQRGSGRVQRSGCR